MNNELAPADARALLVKQLSQLDQNPAAVYLASLPSQQSRDTMKIALNRIAGVLGFEPVTVTVEGKRKKSEDVTYLYVEWSAMRYQHTAAIRARLIANYSPATANKMLSALRGVIKEAWRLGQMNAEDYQRAVDLEGVKVNTLPAGRDLAEGEVLALVKACIRDDSAAGYRDAAIIGLLSGGGLRRAELVKLQLEQFDADTGTIAVKHGKGGKERSVPVANGTLAALADWLDLRGQEPGALFLPINKGGHIVGQRMTAQAVYNMLKKRAKEAGVKNFSPHDFRRTYAGDLLDAGVDIVTVAKLMGHANVETTGRYDRRPEEVKRQAASKLHFPYQRRI
jgi:integrase